MRSLIVATAVLVAAGLANDAKPAQAFEKCANGHCSNLLGAGHHGRFCSECRPMDYGRPDLFYNYYVPPNCGGVGAQLYTAPGPVPQNVGQTYFTYQPLMPHEYLYKHKRTYHRYHDEGRGFTRTSVHWR